MTEKNMILNQWANRHSVIAPRPKESLNPVIRFLNRCFNGFSAIINKWATP